MEAEQGGTMGDQDRLEKFDETFRTGQQGQQGGSHMKSASRRAPARA
jgi:hypothetical protein